MPNKPWLLLSKSVTNMLLLLQSQLPVSKRNTLFEGCMKKKNAFTLVELLVVISILSILASLLHPALKNAIAKTYQVSCASNLKQQYLGFVQFAEDNNDRVPPTSHKYTIPERHNGDYLEGLGTRITKKGEVRGEGGYWIQALGPYLGHPEWYIGYRGSPDQSKIKRAMRTSVANCPAHIPTEASFDRITYGKSSRLGYASSKVYASGSDHRTSGDYPMFITIRFPSQAVLVTDTNRTPGIDINPKDMDDYQSMLTALSVPGSGSGGYRSDQWLRHSLGCMVLFAEGHVEYVFGLTMIDNMTSRGDEMGANRLRR
jgi:prepilin-type N-terminal cleavage/methylation domain-containing protein